MKKIHQNHQNIIQGKWWKIKKNIKQIIPAKYDKIKEWTMDPKGYFLIKVDKKDKLIRVGYCMISKSGKEQNHNIVAEITGVTAISIVNTLIKNKFISILQHAADMGIELNKAEMSLKYDFEYIQDKDLGKI